MTITLGVQDLMPRHEDVSTEQAFHETLALAQYVDQLGYRRIWFSEHHNTNSVLSSAPELMVAHVAGITHQIRVGVGGIMVMHYAALKVAEQMKVLSALAPGRIDFGMGRAPGGDTVATDLLAQGHPDLRDDQYHKIETILQLITDQPISVAHHHKAIAIPTDLNHWPEPWLLGASGQSVRFAAEQGLAYSFATFFGIHYDPAIYQIYREHFQSSVFFQAPRVSACYGVICAEDTETVNWLARPVELQRLQRYHYEESGYVSPNHARYLAISPDDQSIIADYYHRRVMIKGTPDQVADILKDEAEKYQLDEILIYSPIADIELRRQNYKLIMDAMKE
ncbi:MAG: MsnO8 family LLM class oxidoreductase [Aerococcus sp.]|nr:MsnO8 family LLM class oxidoreductase [Aerococcus sp.]